MSSSKSDSPPRDEAAGQRTGAVDWETYDRLVDEGQSERIARAKAKAAFARKARQAAQGQEPAPRDEVMPEGQWAFDGTVTEVFDDMLARSIPEHERMRELVSDLAARFLRPDGALMDLGTSRGEAIARLDPDGKRGVRFYGFEISEPMRLAATARFHGLANVSIRDHDLRQGIPAIAADVDVILSVLTLMFTPIEYRMGLVDQMRQRLRPGGALILVEKVLGANATIDRLLVDAYYDTKRTQGYSEEQIQRKRLALEGVLVPVTAAWNEELLRLAGFSAVDCFWRSLNFSGWIAVA